MTTPITDKAAGIILAAGSSSRMGEPKQLLKREKSNFIDYVVHETLKSDLDFVVLVLGYRASDIREGLGKDIDHKRLKIVLNSHWRKGISSSIISGLKEIQDQYKHCMIILADMPFITAGLINLLLHQYIMSGQPLGAIGKGNRRSLPVIFESSLFNELHQLEGDVGARRLFTKYRDRVCLVEPEDDYDDMDIDTIRDYEKFLKTS